MKLNLMIAGAPGCGKGTQSELIVKHFNLRHFSTGDLLRQEIAEQTPLGKEIDAIISKGNFVPDSTIIEILTKAIGQLSKQCDGILLDGYPRTRTQAEALEEMMNESGMPMSLFIDLQVPENELINRLLIRGETSGRSDDNLETIRKRLEIYHVKTEPVNDFYKKLNKYVAINGLGSVDEIFDRIRQVLEEELSKATMIRQ